MSGSVAARGAAEPIRHRRLAGYLTPAELLPRWAPVALVLLAVPFMRPNVLGETMSPIGFILACAGAAVALLRTPERVPGDPIATDGATGSAALLIAFLGLGYAYVLSRAVVFDPGRVGTATVQGLVLTVGSLVAIAVVCRDPQTRTALARGFVVLMVVLCASYAVTASIWAVAGIGNGQIGTVPIGYGGEETPLYFPLTPTAVPQMVFDVSVPRFTGIGREPGWMAMYCAIAFFLAEMVGVRRWWVKPLLLIGLLGCVSTAGFGVFVVTWAYHRFLRARGGIGMTDYLRQVLGLGVMALAAWVAVSAPVVGFSAKSTQNEISLDERSAATRDGIDALFHRPWGGESTVLQGGINLISDIGVSGLPFVVLVCAGLLLTIRSGSARFSNAVVVIVLLTMLTSQPAKDSTWAFGLVVLACTLRPPEAGPRTAGRTPDAPARPALVGAGRARGRAISLASATEEDLAGIEGIGPTLAARIVAWRARHGDFTSVEQLLEVPGIGPARMGALRSAVVP